MLRAYKYRIYPNKNQKDFIEKHFSVCRLLWNLALEVKITAWKSLANKSVSIFELKREVKYLRKDYDWIKEINCDAQHLTLLNLEKAYIRFFKEKKGFPKFKSKKGRQSFQLSGSCKVDFDSQKIFIPKLEGGIKIIFHRKFKGKIKTTTFSRNPDGKYFASILVENETKSPFQKPILENTAIGIDMGLKNFAILSDGQKIDIPKFLRKSEDKLGWMSKKFSHKKKGSNRWKRYKNRISKIHSKIKNQRENFLHNVSDAIVKQYDTICMEKLNIRGMSRKCKPIQDENGTFLPNRQSIKSGLNKSIADAGWHKFLTMLEYKSKWNGKNFIQIAQFVPSSKLCSNCGEKNEILSLKDREWVCAKCGTFHDRDINASMNIKKIGIEALRGTVYCPSGRRGVHKKQDVKNPEKESNEASKNENLVLSN